MNVYQHMEVNQYAKKIKETHPDFKIALGMKYTSLMNEDLNRNIITLFLIAKDAEGHSIARNEFYCLV